MNLKIVFLKFFLKRNKEKFDRNCITKILFIRPAKIGDAIVSFPLLRELKKNFPSASIDVLAGVNSIDTFKRISYINKIYLKYKKRQFFKTWISIFKLRKNKYDLIIDTTDIKFWFLIATRIINAKYYFSQDSSQRYNGYLKSDLNFYDKVLEYNYGLHYTYRMSNYLELFNIKKYDTTLEFPLKKDEKLKAIDFQNNLKNKEFIVINIDASSEDRSISNTDLLRMLNNLNKKLKNTSIIIFCLPSRREEIMTLLEEYNKDFVKLAYPSKTIFEVSALLSLSKLLISPDTSFVHIASAFNLNQICFYRDNDNHILDWGPLSENNIVIRSNDKNNNSIQGFDHNKIIESLEKLNIVN